MVPVPHRCGGGLIIQSVAIHETSPSLHQSPSITEPRFVRMTVTSLLGRIHRRRPTMHCRGLAHNPSPSTAIEPVDEGGTVECGVWRVDPMAGLRFTASPPVFSPSRSHSGEHTDRLPVSPRAKQMLHAHAHARRPDTVVLVVRRGHEPLP